MSDLFGSWLPALWTKARPEGTPPVFMIHRFLASDRDLAEACRVLQRDLREPAIIFRVWQGLLPKESGAPRFSYPAPKKGPAAEELTLAVMKSESVRRAVAEDMIRMWEETGTLPDAYLYYGVDGSPREKD